MLLELRGLLRSYRAKDSFGGSGLDYLDLLPLDLPRMVSIAVVWVWRLQEWLVKRLFVSGRVERQLGASVQTSLLDGSHQNGSASASPQRLAGVVCGAPNFHDFFFFCAAFGLRAATYE